ncbi:MAG TPA: Mur ligase family protein [Acidimicrobiales bacterium]|nr:Mur ligase family protein [Acidimicrobiales bacterium]
MTGVLALVLTAVVTAVTGYRWLRVAQVEHYLPGSVLLVASRWWSGLLVNGVIAGVAVAVLVLGPVGGFVSLLLVGIGPFGLPLVGRTSKIRPTRRMRTLAITWLVLQVAAVAFLTIGMGVPLSISGAVTAMGVPALIDLALLLLQPIENAVSARWAKRASQRLAEIDPTVVAITGSYGKTTTKALVAHLLSGSKSVLASPASWNNRAGLARAVNEQLAPGTEVFVAEMGTYGPGEIRDMCRWFPPQVSVITAIGPVHLERFGSLERTLTSKAEIVSGASHVVLNVDDERLAALAHRVTGSQDAPAPEVTVWRCSAVDPGADVAVIPGDDGSAQVRIHGAQAAEVATKDAAPTNLACAVAAALACGMNARDVSGRLSQPLPVPDHRLSRSTGAKGFTILDDTFNSNPAGALRALDALHTADGDGRRVVVTPGMVELGPLQDEANEAFAAASSEVASTLVVVGRTNRRALLRGAKIAGLETVTTHNREAAVEWVKATLGPGDTVLYENDLPDTYP